MSTAISEVMKRRGARAYCGVLDIRESALIESLIRDEEAPKYPDFLPLWECETLDALRAHVQEVAGSAPVSFIGKAQVAYLTEIEKALGLAVAGPVPAPTAMQPPRRQTVRQVAAAR